MQSEYQVLLLSPNDHILKEFVFLKAVSKFMKKKRKKEEDDDSPCYFY